MAFLLAVVLVWTVLYALVCFLEARSNGRLSAFLNSRNITIWFGYANVTTTAFNASLEHIGKRHRRLLKHWFSAGVCFGFIGLLASVVILASHLVSSALTPLGPLSPVSSVHIDASARASRAPDGRPWWIPSLAWRLAVARDHEWLRDGHKWTDRGKQKLQRLREWRRRHKSRKRAQLRGFHSRREAQLRGVTDDENETTRNGRRLAQLHYHLPHGRPGRSKFGSSQHVPVVARYVTEIKPRTESKVGHPNSAQQVPVSVGDAIPESTTHTNSIPQQEVKPVAKTSGEERRPASPVLTPLLPGVTIPAFHVFYIAIAILVAAIIHELGHALAAAMCDAQVTGVGGFVALVFPGAYVNLQGIEKLSAESQLRVYCAGAWHNFTGAIAALLLIAVLPQALSPLYVTGAGALVVSMPEMSPLRNYMQPGDIVIAFGRFKVFDGGGSFRSAVKNLVLSKESVGFCVSESLFGAHSRRRDLRCCDPSTNATSSHLQCFSLVGIAKRMACIEPDVVSAKPTCHRNFDCPGFQPPREPTGLTTDTLSHAGRSLQAAIGPRQPESPPPTGVRASPPPQPPRERERCVMAVLPDEQTLVDIRVKSVRTGHTNRLIYEGFPQVLGFSVSVSSYIPRAWSVLPAPIVRLVAAADIPNHLERLLQYFASISLALALLNMAPVFRFDGEHSSMLFLRALRPKLSNFSVERVRFVILRVGTGLLGLNILLALVQYDIQKFVPP